MPKIIAGYASDTGRVRERNEDLALVDPPLFAVADGMGGHAGGAEAASLAITALRQSYRSQSGVEGLIHAIRYANFIVWQKGAENSHLSGMGTTLATLAYLTGGTSDTPNGAIAGIEDSYNAESGAELSVGAKTSGARYATRKLATNKKWYQRLLHTGRHTGRHYENAQKVDGGFARTYPSTVSQQDRYGRAAQQLQQGTATEAASDKHSSGASPHDNGGHFVVANVGDSRIYRYHSGRMIQISQDHSVAEELVRKGELTGAEAAVHPKRHTLTRVIGMGQEIDIDMWEVPAETGDRFLLCTDGLSNEVSDETLSDILSARIDPQQAAELMVKTANKNGGSDNITAVIVDVLPDSLPDSMAYNTVDSISQNDVPTRSTDTGRQLPESPTTPADQSSSAPVEGSTLTSPGNVPSGAGLSGSLPPTVNSPGSASRGTVQSDDAAVRPSALSGEEGSSTADSTTVLSVAAIKTAGNGIGAGTGGGTGTGEYAASGSAVMQNSIGVQRSTRAQSSTRTQKNYAVKRVVGSGVPSPPVARWWHSGSGHRGRSMFNQGSNGYSRNRVEGAGSSRVSGQSLPRYEPEYRRYSGHRLISFRSVLFTIVFLAVVAAAFGLIRWYVSNSYFVMLKGNRVEVFQGRIGGFLGIEPHRVQITGATASSIASYRLPQLKVGVEEPSVAAADAYIKDLLAEKRSFDHSSVPGVSGSYVCSTPCGGAGGAGAGTGAFRSMSDRSMSYILIDDYKIGQAA